MAQRRSGKVKVFKGVPGLENKAGPGVVRYLPRKLLADGGFDAPDPIIFIPTGDRKAIRLRSQPELDEWNKQPEARKASFFFTPLPRAGKPPKPHLIKSTSARFAAYEKLRRDAADCGEGYLEVGRSTIFIRTCTNCGSMGHAANECVIMLGGGGGSSSAGAEASTTVAVDESAAATAAAPREGENDGDDSDEEREDDGDTIEGVYVKAAEPMGGKGYDHPSAPAPVSAVIAPDMSLVCLFSKMLSMIALRIKPLQ